MALTLFMQLFMTWSNTYAFPDPDADPPRRGRLEDPPENILKYAKEAEAGLKPQVSKYGQLKWINGELGKAITAVKNELGTAENVNMPPSALEPLSPST